MLVVHGQRSFASTPEMQIDAKSPGQIVGANAGNELYSMQAGGWSKLPGAGIYISCVSRC